MVESDISVAVKLCLDNWTALKLALDMGWGEEQNRMNAETEIINYIIGYQVSVEDVAQLLDYIMEEKFSTLLERSPFFKAVTRVFFISFSCSSNLNALRTTSLAEV